MTTRQTTITICAGIVGIIIAAGALSFAGSMTASTLAYDPSRAPGFTQYLNRNTQQAQPAAAETLKYTTVQDEQASSSSSSSSSVAPDPGCTAVTAAARDMRTAQARVLPGVRNADTRSQLSDALQAIIKKYCQPVAAASASSSSVSGCDQYASWSLRYTQCKIEEKQGMEYRGY